MSGRKRIMATVCALALAFVCAVIPFSAGAADHGNATIGFSAGGIDYAPLGISGVESGLSLGFGTHEITNNAPTQTFHSVNSAGYVVNNKSGGASAYTVTLGVSGFDYGLEGATLTVTTDSQGLVSDVPGAQNPPVLFGGGNSVELETDGTTAVLMQASRYSADPSHVGLGLWGANFEGDLKVYSNTILAGTSRAVMTWELVIA